LKQNTSIYAIFIGLAALFFMLQGPVAQASELWLTPAAEGSLAVGSLADISRFGVGGSVDFGLRKLFGSGFCVGIRLGYTAWIPDSNYLASLTMLSAVATAGWRFQLAPGFGVEPYIGVGGDVLLATDASSELALESGSDTSSVSSQFLVQAGADADLALSETVDLNLNLAWRLIGEQASVYNSFVLGVGVGFRAGAFADPVPAAPEKETVYVKTVVKSPQDVSFDNLMNFDTINVLRNRNQTRIVLLDSFVANDAQFNTRMENQLPAIVDYIKAVPGIKNIEVLGYVADDGVARNDIAISTARALLVRDWLQARLKPDWQAIPARGMGKANPVADNTSEEGRRKNRRLEIVLTLE